MSRERLIDSLAGDLTPVTPPLRPLPAALAWWLGSWVFVIAVTLATGPMRSGFETQLATIPRFALECLVGLAASLAAIWGALELAVPGPRSVWRRTAAAASLLGLWLVAYVIGTWAPAIEPSMLGKREGCFYQTLVFAVAPFLVGLWLLRRRVVLDRAWAGLWLGAAAAGIPALIMQVACMYDPLHMLEAHLLPVLMIAGLGAVSAGIALRRL
jgi:hypothetical protein